MIKRIKQKLKRYILGSINYARELGVEVGENCKFISLPDFGSEPYLITIGNHTEICSNVTFITHDGATWVFRDKERYKDVIRFGKIKIGNNCFIGKGTTILPGVTIGDNSIIGACSLVTKDVPAGSVYGGVPAHMLSTTSEFAEKCLRQTPIYNKERYATDKKGEVLKMLKNENR